MSARFIEMRKHPRLPVTAQAPHIRLMREGSATPVLYKAVDVSRTGLGIVTDDGMLVSEESLILSDGLQSVRVKLCWCVEAVRETVLEYRYGLESVVPDFDLVAFILGPAHEAAFR